MGEFEWVSIIPYTYVITANALYHGKYTCICTYQHKVLYVSHASIYIALLVANG